MEESKGRIPIDEMVYCVKFPEDSNSDLRLILFLL